MFLKPKGDQILKKRLELGLSRNGLGQKAGLSGYAITRMEEEIHHTHPLRAKAVADALGCKVSDVFEEIGTKRIREPYQRRIHRGKNQLGLEIIKKLYVSNMTRRDFAVQIGINENYLSVIIKGYHTPRPLLLKKIADALGIEVEEALELASKAS